MENPRNRYSMDDSPARQRYDDGEGRSSRTEREWDPPIYRREGRSYSRSSYRDDDSYRSRSSYRDGDSYRSRSSYRDGDSYRSRDSYRDGDSYRSRDSYRDERPVYREREAYRRDAGEASGRSYGAENARRNPPPRAKREDPRPAARAPRKRQSPLQRMLSRFAPLLLIAGMLIAAVIVLIVLLSGGKKADPVQDMPQATAVPTAVPTAAPAQDEFQADKEPAAPMQQAPVAPVENPAAQAPAAPAQLSAVQTPTVPMPTEYSVLSGIPQTDRLLGLQENTRVPDSYFDDVIFIGDSVSMKLTYYVMNERKDNPRLLGNAEFLTSANVSSRNALKDVSSTSLHPTYKGQKMSFEDAIAASGKKKVYIMLGLNDVGVSGINKSVENLMTFIKRIKDRNPDVLIFVQSATPRVTGDRPTTKELFEYNMRVYDYCLQLQDQGVYFVDVAYIFRDENGNLFPDYCSDLDSMALHFNNSACRLWIDFLYTHALV